MTGSSGNGMRWMAGLVGLVIAAAIGIGAVLAVLASVIGDDETPVLALEIGDCVQLDLAPSGPDLARVPRVSCEQEHNGEVFHAEQLDPDGDRAYPPSDDILFREVIFRCVRPGDLGEPSPFETFVGVPFSDSEFDVFPIAPDPEAWVSTGGRFVCLVVPAEDDAVLIGSVRGSKR
jgi:hypothetical protein